MPGFKWRVAIVVGMDSEVLRQTVRLLVGDGAQVYLASEDAVIAALIGELGHNNVDGRSLGDAGPDSIERAILETERRFGRLDIAVHFRGDNDDDLTWITEHLLVLGGELPHMATGAVELSQADGAAGAEKVVEELREQLAYGDASLHKLVLRVTLRP